LTFLTELYLDRSVKRPAEIEIKIGLPLFLSIPRLALNGKPKRSIGAGRAPALAENNEPTDASPISDDGLVAPKSLAVSKPDGDEGRSPITNHNPALGPSTLPPLPSAPARPRRNEVKAGDPRPSPTHPLTHPLTHAAALRPFSHPSP